MITGINLNDIKTINISLKTNIVGTPIVDFNLNMLAELPDNIRKKIRSPLPLYTDVVELDFEKVSSLPIEMMYKFFTSREFFQYKINDLLVESSASTSELTQEKRNNNASRNIFTMLKLLFNNTYPNKGNVENSYSILGGEMVDSKSASNMFTYLKHAVKDSFSSSGSCYFTINGKIYTLTRMVWLNDFFNNPKTKELLYEYKKFKRWVENPQINLTGSGMEFFKHQPIWENLDVKDQDELNPITKQKIEIKRFLDKYPPFKTFFYEILKTYIPSITNREIRLILSSTDTTPIIVFFEYLVNFTSIGDIEKKINDSPELQSILRAASISAEPNVPAAAGGAPDKIIGGKTSTTSGTSILTLETPILFEEKQGKIYLLTDFIEGKVDNKTGKGVDCDYRKANIRKNFGKLRSGFFKKGIKPEEKWDIRNSIMYSTEEKKHVKPELEEESIAVKIGEYEVVPYLKPGEKQDIIDLLLKKPNFNIFFENIKKALNHCRDLVNKYETFLATYIKFLNSLDWSNWEKNEAKKGSTKTPEEHIKETEQKFSEYLKPYRDLLEKFSNQLEEISKKDVDEPTKESMKDLFHPKNKEKEYLLTPASTDYHEYKTDYKNIIGLIDKWNIKSREPEIIEDIDRFYSLNISFTKKIDALEKKKDEQYDAINSYNIGKQKSQDDKMENELRLLVKIINLDFNILKYETFNALLDTITSDLKQKVKIKLGGKIVRRTQKRLRKKNKKTRKYFFTTYK